MSRSFLMGGKFFVVGFLLFLSGCCSELRVTKDSFYESFFEKTHLIMTDAEKEVYKVLQDADSKREFIEEFWKIRDPNPSTDENENKIEFENRILFANEWFGNWKTFRGRSMGKGKEKDRGWRTARGRVYIVLGPPDMVNYGHGWEPMRLYNENKSMYETWYYSRYELYVFFYKNFPDTWQQAHSEFGDPLNSQGRGEPYVRDWDYEVMPNTALLYAMEDAKLNMIPSELLGDFSEALRFEARYERGNIKLTIPLERVKFEDEGGRLHAQFHVKIIVYADHKKIDEIHETKTFSFSEDEALNLDEMTIDVPYKVEKKGKYLFDLIVTDLNSMYLAKYRKVVKKE